MQVDARIQEGIFQRVVAPYIVDVRGVKATCLRCGHVALAAGTSDKSRRFAAVKLRKECPLKEANWYRDTGAP